jgi:tRNA-Thr(GGU) m(6)t(6)A37 methyltransferase TsaA
MTDFTFSPIGLIRSPFPDKFGIPRQPRLAPAAEARLELLPGFDREEAFTGLDGFSHVWLLFVFHVDCLDAGWRPTVRPPRLGGRGKVGVFASRAPYRPNPIGLSAVAHHGLTRNGGGLGLRLAGVDLLDGTPVLDIKPYLPYADRIDAASGGFAARPPARRWPVRFSALAHAAMAAQDPDGRLRLKALIEQVVAQDPRPGYMDRYPARRHYGLKLYHLEIAWEIVAAEDGCETALVQSVTPVERR